MSDRGQAYSLQGVIGAIIIASALVMGLQAVSIEPFTDGGAGQGVDTRVQMTDTLDVLEDQDALRTGLLCLGGTNETTPHEGVVSTSPTVDPVGTILNRTASTTAEYNIYVAYKNETGGINQTLIGSRSQPTGSTVTVTREVALFDSDPVFELDEDSLSCVEDTQYDNLGDVPDGDIYLHNQNESSDLYSVVQVRVIAW